MVKLFQCMSFFLFLSNACVSASTSPVSLKLTAIKVSDNVYSIVAPSYGRPTAENQGWNSNSHFIITGDGVLVVDTGSSESIGQAIKNAIQDVTEQPIRWVVNSHSHADHWLGNGAFKSSEVEFISSSLTLQTMAEDGPADVKAFQKMTQGITGESPLIYPTTMIDKSLKRQFGHEEVEFHLAQNGHSPGDIYLWLPNQRIVLGGDLLSTHYLPIMTPRGNVTNLIATLKKLEQLAPKSILTGHGEPAPKSAISRDIAFLTSVWKGVKTGLSQAERVESIVKRLQSSLGPQYRAEYQDFDSSIQYLVEMMVEKQQGV
ncbi:MBL fold metallo-hydrolase (plasmid) [Pseudoalteromonas xiamenensis]|uniref:MBL fold metallo-hydrolase n=1 Tax=Pseudoalteromonas xiamenensis TaxID=882626 RepID=UPI0027E3E2EC|nr:MBL fold metallo-hydrolase [Pseudoalteromonas xiamenensis]WMN62058.1 MBL fold metallo-hydrolase [Pseudoalteromonas xiamenensis]